MMLRIRLIDGAGLPVQGATVRLIGDLAHLGDDRRAVANSRGAVTWTRPLTGYSGSLWNCWQRFVSHQVAGITWDEFRREAAQYNPSLRETDDLMVAHERYFVPENRVYADMRGNKPGIVWDRELVSYDGDLWKVWRERVQGKVLGLTWEAFRMEFGRINGGPSAGDTVRLPRNEGQEEYTRVAYSGLAGYALFEELAPGAYRLEIAAEGYEPCAQELVAPQADEVIIRLEELVVVVAKGDTFVRRAGRDFAIDGRRFRFMGVNLRGLVHYGLNDPVRFADARQQLKAAREMGARVVRVFAPHVDISAEDTINRIRGLLGLMQAEFPDMYLVVALSNLYSDVAFRVPGDANWGPGNVYTLQPGGSGAHILGLDWFAGGYKNAYLPFAQKLVGALRDEPQIMAYNVGNELKADTAPELLVNFIHDAAAKIRQWDGGNHLITTGMISTRHAWMGGNDGLRVRLYSSPNLDFITNHSYHGDDDPNTNREWENDAPSREDDSDLAFRLGKPLVIEEAGFVGHEDRSGWYEKELRTLLDEKKAAGYMLWGFMVGQDNGDGDVELGVDHMWHNADWGRLNDLFRARAAALAADNGEVAAPKPVVRLGAGQKVFTQTSVNMRKTSGLSGEVVKLLPPRTPGEITGSSVVTDGLTWWPVRMTVAGTTLTGYIAQANKSGTVLLGLA
jgi:hypothetical protein